MNIFGNSKSSPDYLQEIDGSDLEILADRLMPFIVEKMTAQSRSRKNGFNYNQKLPSWLSEIDFPLSGNLQVKMAVSTDRGPFDKFLEGHAELSINANIAIEYLNGKGTLIDIGANIGSISLPVAKSGSNVVSVEMLPDNVSKLNFSVLLNKFANMRIVQAAASREDGLAFYSGSEAWGVVTETGSQSVAYKLDTIVRMIELSDPNFIQHPIFLKVDVEGHEAAVFEGAAEFLAEFRPTILFEAIDFQGREAALAAKEGIVSAGYELFLLFPSVLCPYDVNRLQVPLVADFLAVPKEKISELSRDFPTYEIRNLTDQEIADNIMFQCDFPNHRNHVVRVLESLGAIRNRPCFEQVREKLLQCDDADIAKAAAAIS